MRLSVQVVVMVGLVFSSAGAEKAREGESAAIFLLCRPDPK